MSAHSDNFNMTDDLRDLSQMYRDATAHEDEPSPALDATILAAAHRAVASRPQAVSARKPLRFVHWRVPLSLAASLMIGVLIVVLLKPGETGPETHVLAQAPPEALPMAEMEVTERKEVPLEALAMMEMPQPSQIHTPLQAEVDEMARRESSAAPTVRRKAAAAAQRPQSDENPGRTAESASRSDTRIEHPVLAQAHPSPAAPEEIGVAEVFIDTPTPHANTPTPHAISSTAMAPAEMARQRAGAAPLMAKSRVTEDASAYETRETPTRWKSPQAWLEDIEKLRREEKIKEARESLIEFRKRYPDHELPKALRDL
ncbi:MAG: hypothetical protein LBV29_07565 [Azoarcus sp.]|jgi:Meckel syndrome type 1 protein|nr:hypothetical protein [Azoarcus sp.]